MNAAQRKNSLSGSHKGSTQKFIEIENIVENIVILRGGNACLVVEVQASNFALLSQEEQQSKIYSYASMLNSLSFPIQILIRNKKIDISIYIKSLNKLIEKSTTIHQNLSSEQNQALLTHMQYYRDFIQDLIKTNEVLDKKFYLILTYSSLEQGVSGAAAAAKKGAGTKESFFISAKSSLFSKAETIHAQLARMSLRAKTLDYKDLVSLFYAIYNGLSDESLDITSGISSTVIGGVLKT